MLRILVEISHDWFFAKIIYPIKEISFNSTYLSCLFFSLCICWACHWEYIEFHLFPWHFQIITAWEWIRVVPYGINSLLYLFLKAPKSFKSLMNFPYISIPFDRSTWHCWHFFFERGGNHNRIVDIVAQGDKRKGKRKQNLSLFVIERPTLWSRFLWIGLVWFMSNKRNLSPIKIYHVELHMLCLE